MTRKSSRRVKSVKKRTTHKKTKVRRKHLSKRKRKTKRKTNKKSKTKLKSIKGIKSMKGGDINLHSDIDNINDLKEPSRIEDVKKLVEKENNASLNEFNCETMYDNCFFRVLYGRHIDNIYNELKTIFKENETHMLIANELLFIWISNKKFDTFPNPDETITSLRNGVKNLICNSSSEANE